MSIGNTIVGMNIRLRVEELRLYIWGRSWGIRIDDGNRDVSAAETGIDLSQSHQPDNLDSIDDQAVPGLRELAIDILIRMRRELNEWKVIGERYDHARPSMEDGGLEATSKLMERLSVKQAKEEKRISDLTRFRAKMRWSLKDKASLDEILVRLIGLNDSLEKLLPRRESVNLARGLAAEILNVMSRDTDSSAYASILGFDKSLDTSLHHESKTQNILQLKSLNQTDKDENTTQKVSGNSPFAATWDMGGQQSMKIEPQDFVQLPDPDLSYHEIWEDSQTLYAPPTRTLAVYAPKRPPQCVKEDHAAHSLASQIPVDVPAQSVLVEWRPTARESPLSELSDEELHVRRDHVARLLSRTATTDADFRVLNCIGYVESRGHTPDGQTHGVVGYVFQYPDFASPLSRPVTLRDLLGQAYSSDNPRIPPLETRFSLARSLCIALSQLQSASWVHRRFSSYNIIFFRTKDQEHLDVSQPFVAGWQYSRPDDPREVHGSGGMTNGIGDLDIYVHPRKLRRQNGRFPRFRKSFDVYSLGVVLLEIAFWEPIMALLGADQREKMQNFAPISSESWALDWKMRIQEVAREEIAAEMGTGYRQAVLYCLGCADSGESYQEEADAFDVARDVAMSQDVGIEKDFFWNVVQIMDHIKLP